MQSTWRYNTNRTYSAGLSRFLEAYPLEARLAFDRRVILEVFRNGTYQLCEGETGAHFSGRGIILTFSNDENMKQQLRDALHQQQDGQADWSPVEKELGKRLRP